jgi:hypothetical protein
VPLLWRILFSTSLYCVSNDHYQRHDSMSQLSDIDHDDTAILSDDVSISGDVVERLDDDIIQGNDESQGEVSVAPSFVYAFLFCVIELP